MGSHLGYIGNDAVYDNRMRGLPAPHGEASQVDGSRIAVTQLSGEERFQRKLESLRPRVCEPCELLVPYRSERGWLSCLVMDGVAAGEELIAFHLRGNGVRLVYDSELPNSIHPGKLRVFEPGELRQHHCHARGCTNKVPPRLFMCRKHWSMIPNALQAAIWRHYQPGQELGAHTPTRTYLEYTDQAIAAVADFEAARAAEKAQREAEYQARQQRRRQLFDTDAQETN